MIKQMRRYHFLVISMIMGCIVIACLSFSAVHATTGDLTSDSAEIAAHSNFLRPEASLLTGCVRLKDHYKKNREHYCIADFTEAEQWESKNFDIETIIDYPFDDDRESHILSARLSTTNSTSAKTEFRLSSMPARQTRFNSIESVRIRVKGNGSPVMLRIWLADRDGEVFTHQRPLRLNFNEWALEEVSFAENYVLSHGKLADGVPDPPMVLHNISVSGSPDMMHSEIRLDRISAVGTPWEDKPSPQNHSQRQFSTGPATSSLDLALEERAGKDLPITVGNTLQLKFIATNNLESTVNTRVKAYIHRVLGETKLYEITNSINAGEHQRITIPVTDSIPGWYRVIACIHHDEKPLSCVRDEYFVWDPANNVVEDTPPTFPGAMMSADLFLKDLNTDMNTMKMAGVKVLRFPFRWERIEATRGNYNWRPYDLIFEACSKANIIPQPMVVQTPDWARRAPYRNSRNNKSTTSFTPPEDMEVFKEFMRKAAKRYAKHSPYWEIWNEPISRAFWAGGTNEDYIELLRAGYNGIRSADEMTPILSAGAWASEGAPERFSRHLMENGRDYFDILAVHSHGGVHRLSQELADYDALWFGVPDRPPIWLNETGVTVDPLRQDGELLKAAETIKKLVVARAHGIENFGWFIFKHVPNSYHSPYNNYSAMNEHGEPRPVLLAYNNAIRWLRKTQLVRVSTISGRYSAYEFSYAGKKVLVAWTHDIEAFILFSQLPEWAADGVDIYDLFGGRLPIEPQAELHTIELSGIPIFIVSKNSTQ